METDFITALGFSESLFTDSGYVTLYIYVRSFLSYIIHVKIVKCVFIAHSDLLVKHQGKWRKQKFEW